MKFLQSVHQFKKGIRLYAFFLSFLMLWAMLCGIAAFGKLRYYSLHQEIFSTCDVESTNFLTLKYDPFSLAKQEASLEALPNVQYVFSTHTAYLLSYNGIPVKVVLYEPEMLEYFPKLKLLGIDFSKNPNGCILGRSLSAGSEITLTSDHGKYQQPVADYATTEHREAAFPVIGYLNTPYQYMTLGGDDLSYGNPPPDLELLFQDDPVVLMQKTEEVMEKLTALTPMVEHDDGFLVVFKLGLTVEEQRTQLVEASVSNIRPLSLLEQYSQTAYREALKEELPQPLLLAATALVAYLSIAILILQKKQQALAQMYLCGASQRRCGAVAFAALQSVCLLPVILCTVFIFLWPKLYWPALQPLNLAVNGGYAQWLFQNPDLLALWTGITEYLSRSVLISPDCILVVLGYWLLTVVISLLLTLGFLKKHTPVTCLKGAAQ